MAPSLFAPGLVLAAPLLLLSVGLVPATWANARPRLMARLSGAAAWLAFVGALLAAAVHPFDGAHAWSFYRVELPGGLGAFSLGTYVNSVTVIMLVLVAFVGAIVTRYSRNYLDGDPDRGRFNKWLALTLAAILTLIVSGNLLMFALAWIATSLCLHQLLMFYRKRPAAVLAAHKKFVASRIGDLSLLVAIVLIGFTLHTLEFDEMFRILETLEGPLPMALEIAALLIVLSAGLKSAQFPFHGWLLQVMEAPTPVSALLHAGIVNAGAFLVIRMSPVMSHSQLALGVLAVMGLVTLALASLVMLTQTSIKVSLAWSTTAQMGFMLLECGLGLYSLAMLHLVAHSLYKAHAFLASGSGVDAFRAPAIPYTSHGVEPVRLLLSLAGGGLIAVAVGAAFGVTAEHQPALLAAGAVVAVAMSQLLLQTASLMSGSAFLLRGLGLSTVVSVAYFALHALFETALQGSVLPVQDAAESFQILLALAVVGVFLVLLVLQQVLKYTPASLGDGIYMHLYNGLYIDVYITRLLQRVWPSPPPEPGSPPAPFARVPSTGA
ncbi:NADH:ubiquinone oxidoreductase subunit 5 (chain L)/multisubunit Na+/H+ antiporter, MnhA subunit [Thioflavicoccus mobilis 8321]|uniref:Probable inorganic carbon transporter subunit DabB n=1 Tax=Thioflavicoccus mobilis 8321 TaxID=765912 RepID=L0H0Q0_9GAMM|nr:NADH-quinone oxidoreductase subunit L [Thioflavicoccus mobilis]AGA91637.1 NADH:ubiquinone oxidoreductase subunit 5 (chain L)/multisubunit Na+/H+ antiporter, MnhA subunit [Thioflavicoccus mobilis 8321]